MINLTEQAAEAVKHTIEEKAEEFDLDREKAVLRVGVRGGGCSGFSYLLHLDPEPRDNDEMFEQHGIRVVCDPKSLLYLNGAEIDYKTDDGGLIRGFTFNNPNATSSCGCGSSFSA